MPRGRFLSQDGRVLPGIRGVVLVTAPAAGQEWSVTVPGGQKWRVTNARFLLTTSATVANRFAGVRITDGTNVLFEAAVNSGIAASNVAPIIASNQMTTSVVTFNGQFSQLPLPRDYLEPGYVLSSRTLNLQATDQFSTIVLLVEQVYITDEGLSDLAASGGTYDTI